MLRIHFIYKLKFQRTSAHCKYNRNASSGAGTFNRASIVWNNKPEALQDSLERTKSKFTLSLTNYLSQKLKNFLWCDWCLFSKRIFFIFMSSLQLPDQLHIERILWAIHKYLQKPQFWPSYYDAKKITTSC